MAQVVYECMMILDPNAYARDPGGASNGISEMIQSVGGEVLVSRLWNEQKLAFPIEGHRKGVYWLTYINMESTDMTKLNRACQLNDTIIRHMAIKIDPRLVDTLVAVAKGEAQAAVPDGMAEPAKEEDSKETSEKKEVETVES